MKQNPDPVLETVGLEFVDDIAVRIGGEKGQEIIRPVLACILDRAEEISLDILILYRTEYRLDVLDLVEQVPELNMDSRIQEVVAFDTCLTRK